MKYKSEWKTCKLGDICDSIYSGGTPSRKEASFWVGPHNWLSSGETGERYINSTNETITDRGASKTSTKMAEKGSVVIASAGQGYTRGQVSYLNIDTYINQSVIALRTDENILSSKYLFFNLSSKYNELRKISDGNSIRGSITTKMLKDLEIILPLIKVQKKIANILSSFDDKIENNNKIINNLEEQAQAIFKSWFVDFEPFQDGEFVESELGDIPKDWKVVTLKEISQNIVTGKTPPTIDPLNYGKKMPFITIPDMHDKVYVVKTERCLSDKGVISQKNKTLQKNTIVVSCIATVGLVSLVSEDSQTNQQINSVIVKNNVSPYYVYNYLKTQLAYLNAVGSSGSTTKNVNKTTFSNLNILYPEQEALDKYHEICEPIFEYILLLLNQNIRLEKIRDTLLPKLMSGEIRVNED